MIKKEEDNRKFYYVSCGGWESVVLASDRSSALIESLEEVISSGKGATVSTVMICLDISGATTDISLEDSLKFIPIAEVVPLLSEDTLRELNRLLENE